MLAQLFAGARTRPALAPVLSENFELLAAQVSGALDRILVDTPLAGLVDTRQLARTVSAGFIGVELLDTVTGDDVGLFDTLDTLADLVDVVLSAGTIPSALIRRRLDPGRRGTG